MYKRQIEACGGSITSAVAFLRAPGSERLAFRTRLFSDLAMLQRADDWDVVEMARALVEASKAPLDEVRASQEEELAENADFLAKSAIQMCIRDSFQTSSLYSREPLMSFVVLLPKTLSAIAPCCLEEYGLHRAVAVWRGRKEDPPFGESILPFGVMD